MSETEKLEQIGRLAEECSHAKGKLAHVNEKLNRAKTAYQLALQNFPNLRHQDNQVNYPTTNMQRAPLEGLLDTAQLVEALVERDRLNGEVAEITGRLKALAPHLF